MVAIAVIFAGIAPAMADSPVFIDFERFPGPDEILGTPDDVSAPNNCSLQVCEWLTNEFASMGITFRAKTGHAVLPGP